MMSVVGKSECQYAVISPGKEEVVGSIPIKNETALDISVQKVMRDKEVTFLCSNKHFSQAYRFDGALKEKFTLSLYPSGNCHYFQIYRTGVTQLKGPGADQSTLPDYIFCDCLD